MAGYDIVPKEKNGNNLGVYNPEYANSTRYMKENGNTYALTYGSSGQFLGSTLVPNYDYNLGVDRSKLGGSAYDRFFMTNTELGRINDARRAAENGTGTWEDANSLAEGIRGSYGYSGGADGTGYTPTGQNVYSGIGSVRDPATLLSGNEQQQLANRLIGNYGNDYTAIVDGRVQTLTGTAQGADGYDNFLRNAQNAGLLGQFSESDLAYAQQNPNFGNALLQSKINYANAATPEQRALAQAEGESLRETMRQSLQTTPVSSGAGGTGVSGTGTGGTGVSGTGVGGSAGTLNNIAGYNYAAYKAEPDYKALMDSWNNNGRLAMQGTLSQASARTGGLASSYGEGVAQQTYQQYMTEAEQEAYNRYRDALNDLYNLYSLQSSQEETMYDEEGNPETVYLARDNDRVKKDGANSSHRVIDKLARYNGDNIRALATVHLSESLEVSKHKNTTDEHSHQWMDENGWIYRTVYLQNKAGGIYEATLNIADGRDRRILYDINNIRKIDKNRGTAGGVVPSSVSGGARSTSHSSSDVQILSKGQNGVKGYFDASSEENFTAQALGVEDELAREHSEDAVLIHSGTGEKVRYNESTKGGEDSGGEVGNSIHRRLSPQVSGEQSAAGAGEYREGKGVLSGEERIRGASGQTVLREDSDGRRLTDEQVQQLQGTSITDATGAPLAVYHFTPEMEFEKFEKGDIGFHFGTKVQAIQRQKDVKTKNGRVFRTYLNIKNPYRVRLDLNSWHYTHIGLYLHSYGILTDAQWDEIMELGGHGYNAPGAQHLREILDGLGIDGFVYPNSVEGEGDSYIALWNEQIVRSEVFNVSGPPTPTPEENFTAQALGVEDELADNTPSVEETPSKDGGVSSEEVENWYREITETAQLLDVEVSELLSRDEHFKKMPSDVRESIMDRCGIGELTMEITEQEFAEHIPIIPEDVTFLDGDALKKGERPEPNSWYVFGENKYICKTDSNRCVELVYADELKMRSREGKRMQDNKTVGKRKGVDHAGHLIAYIFGGSPSFINVVSMLAHLNQSEYKKMENRWKKTLEAGGDVKAAIFAKNGTDGRPVKFEVYQAITDPSGKKSYVLSTFLNEDYRKIYRQGRTNFQKCLSDFKKIWYNKTNDSVREKLPHGNGKGAWNQWL